MDPPLTSYRDLKVWRLGMELSKIVYKYSADFRDRERYGLTSQMRRAATSLPANIAEGHGRDSTKEYQHHLSIARGSLAELETFLLLTRDLEYLAPDDTERALAMTDEFGRMLRGLQNSLRKKVTN